MDKMRLNIALEIISSVRAYAATHDYQPLAVVVLDQGGAVVAEVREDGASAGRGRIAFGKAHGALALGAGSRELMARAQEQPFFISAAAAAIGGNLVPVPGGVIARDARGDIVGAVGVSGDTSDRDEEAAVVGISAHGMNAQA